LEGAKDWTMLDALTFMTEWEFRDFQSTYSLRMLLLFLAICGFV